MYHSPTELNTLSRTLQNLGDTPQIQQYRDLLLHMQLTPYRNYAPELTEILGFIHQQGGK